MSGPGRHIYVVLMFCVKLCQLLSDSCRINTGLFCLLSISLLYSRPSGTGTKCPSTNCPFDQLPLLPQYCSYFSMSLYYYYYLFTIPLSFSRAQTHAFLCLISFFSFCPFFGVSIRPSVFVSPSFFSSLSPFFPHFLPFTVVSFTPFSLYLSLSFSFSLHNNFS
jgi:hypothetical protein